MKKAFFAFVFTVFVLHIGAEACLDSIFINPSKCYKPIMIWQWMDGMISQKGITFDLESFAEAGIGGVQQFHVGGKEQVKLSNPEYAIGTQKWKEMMRFAMDECARLGLTFGTHNCPGWSSSAYPDVKPQYSMQQLVYTDTIISGGRRVKFHLRQPQAHPIYGYYQDIVVLAVPNDSVVSVDRVINLTQNMDTLGLLKVKLPKGEWRIFRFGHTTNGQTNYGTAGNGGVGLECDKMNPIAVEHFWQTYPKMILDIAGDHIGKTFKRIEIDSYEAGGQSWSVVLPNEFLNRRGYDMIPWLVVLAGVTLGDKRSSDAFYNDYKETITDLFAENYYGKISEIVSTIPGVDLIYQPYGAGGGKPFFPINTSKVVTQMSKDQCSNGQNIVCAEFWTHPDWGWGDIPKVMSAVHNNDVNTVWAEGFTCWPVDAWKDDPSMLKVVADRAYCLGINQIMLHAGAQNPWPHVVPGLTFGFWGTQFSPNQTWWKEGAKAFFAYMTCCNAMLQQGTYVDDYSKNSQKTFIDSSERLQWIHRKTENADIFFIANTQDTAFQTTISVKTERRKPEIWYPQTRETTVADAWSYCDGTLNVALYVHPRSSFFLILRENTSEEEPGLKLTSPKEMSVCWVKGPWTVQFSENINAPKTAIWDSLIAWNESQDADIRYYSGTARYTFQVEIDDIDPKTTYCLDLGEVKNMAKISINGEYCTFLWNGDFRADITKMLRKGVNTFDVEVTNLWPNRMIGDEQEAEDMVWSEPYRYSFAPGKPVVGRFLMEEPEWLRDEQPRPSQGRKTVVSFKFFNKDSELLPSGLLGPVKIVALK